MLRPPNAKRPSRPRATVRAYPRRGQSWAPLSRPPLSASRCRGYAAGRGSWRRLRTGSAHQRSRTPRRTIRVPRRRCRCRRSRRPTATPQHKKQHNRFKTYRVISAFGLFVGRKRPSRASASAKASSDSIASGDSRSCSGWKASRTLLRISM